jgi:hypothetical protein
MSRYMPPDPRTYRLPTFGERIGWGVLRSIPVGLFYLGWPYVADRVTSALGVPEPFPIGGVVLLGLGLLALSFLSYVEKPTRAYGPASAVYAAAAIAYLVWLSERATGVFAYQGATISVSFSELVLIAVAVPLFQLVAALVTTAGDAFRPAQRYPFDFPA